MSHCLLVGQAKVRALGYVSKCEESGAGRFIESMGNHLQVPSNASEVAILQAHRRPPPRKRCTRARNEQNLANGSPYSSAQIGVAKSSRAAGHFHSLALSRLLSTIVCLPFLQPRALPVRSSPFLCNEHFRLIYEGGLVGEETAKRTFRDRLNRRRRPPRPTGYRVGARAKG